MLALRLCWDVIFENPKPVIPLELKTWLCSGVLVWFCCQCHSEYKLLLYYPFSIEESWLRALQIFISWTKSTPLESGSTGRFSSGRWWDWMGFKVPPTQTTLEFCVSILHHSNPCIPIAHFEELQAQPAGGTPDFSSPAEWLIKICNFQGMCGFLFWQWHLVWHKLPGIPCSELLPKKSRKGLALSSWTGTSRSGIRAEKMSSEHQRGAQEQCRCECQSTGIVNKGGNSNTTQHFQPVLDHLYLLPDLLRIHNKFSNTVSKYSNFP